MKRIIASLSISILAVFGLALAASPASAASAGTTNYNYEASSAATTILITKAGSHKLRAVYYYNSDNANAKRYAKYGSWASALNAVSSASKPNGTFHAGNDLESAPK